MTNITWGLCLLLTIFSQLIQAQPFWVIETNNCRKDFTIIKFYNDQNVLMYEEKQHGVYFNLSKKRHVRTLVLMLQNYLSSGSPISRKENKTKRSRQF
jgi:hypothetical protein